MPDHMDVRPVKGRTVIAGVGSALVDILVHESEEFLERADAAKGGMKLVESEIIDAILGRTDRAAKVVPGGSACNTIIGVARLGGRGRFIGKRGCDEFGRLLIHALGENNVETVLFESETPTGRVLSLITPDAQRSMFTYLGASGETLPGEIGSDHFKDAAIVHIEGYLLFNPELITSVMEAAKKADALISLDLASYTVVESSKEIVERLVEEYVDILIANEDESRAFTGCGDEEKAIRLLAERAPLAVLKVGARGSYIANGKEIIRVEPMGDGRALDSTGAGDLWASGFLKGFVSGLSLDACGRLASACGYEVCQVVGAQIPEEGWRRISFL